MAGKLPYTGNLYLEIMQKMANQLSISIVDGKYKNGNLKYRKKEELYVDIMEYKKTLFKY